MTRLKAALISCHECVFWAEKAIRSEDDDDMGHCRRRAPSCHYLVSGQRLELAASWPETYKYDSCGDGRCDDEPL